MMNGPGVVADRIEILILARLSTTPKKLRMPTAEGLASALHGYAPKTIDEPRWRELVAEAMQRLADPPQVTAQRQAARDELTRRVGPCTAKDWKQWSERVLPALALGIAPDDARAHKRLGDRDAWCAAIAGRVLDLWSEGPPPSPAALGDALVWRQLAQRGKPKSSPPWLRAHVLAGQVGADASSADQLLRLLAVRAVDAPNAGLQAIYGGLVRTWLTGQTPARALEPSPSHSLVEVVRAAAQDAREGVFGDRKVFIASVWNAVRAFPPWSALLLDDFKARLVAAHRNQELVLARADLVAAMDPALVASSETRAEGGATFHFVVREPIR